MFKTALWATTLALAVSPAAAGSWGFGVGVGYGPPVYWGPPPVYYDTGRPSSWSRSLPITTKSRRWSWRRRGARLRHGGPDVVLDALEMAGYRDLQPMRLRGSIYRLNATDPDGNVVRLDISVHTGDIRRERILVRAAMPPLPAAGAPAPSSSLRDRLQTPPPGERDPLVVY